MSQATAILLGYESIATVDVLGKKATQAPVTPGMSIDVGPTQTAAAAGTSSASSASGGTSGTSASAGSGGTTSTSSKGAAVPLATGNAQLLVSAAAAAAGVIGVVLL